MLKEIPYKFKNTESVKVKLIKDWSLIEYDRHDRITYYEDYTGYYCYKYYDNLPEEKRSMINPVGVIHKYSHLYHTNNGVLTLKRFIHVSEN